MDRLSPVFSCVVPTKGRVKLLGALLASLRKARSVREMPLEVIVIDNSAPAEQEQIRLLCEHHDALFLPGPNSVREKRNMGIRHARGEYVFFIDSDCIAEEHVFERHYEVLSQGDYAACIGVTEFVGEDSHIWHVIANTRFLDSFRFPILLKGKVDSAPWGPTTNFSVRRDVLLQLDGFETALPFALGADDADLGLRINEAGYRIGMAEDAVVYHSRETWSGWKKILKRVFRWGKMDYHLYYRRHLANTALTMPKPVSAYLMIIIIQSLLSIAISRISPMVGILIWPVLYLLFFASIKKRHWRMHDVPLRVLMGAEFVNQVFEFGCAMMSIRHFSFSFLYREPVDDPRSIWHTKMHSVWACCLVSSIVVILDCIWLAFL